MNHDSAPLKPDRRPASLRVLIADDFPEWRKQIHKILNTRPEWEVVAEACDGREALQKAVELRPDLVLLDVGMPVMNGLQAAMRVRQCCPNSRIIFLSQTSDKDVVEAALAVGAVAYLLKTNAALELVAAIAAAQESAAAEENCRGSDIGEVGISSRV